jgi:hypothetical protein
VRPPSEAEIHAPEFPRHLDWLNVAPRAHKGPMLVEFWDHARVNSLRTLPYVRAWHERYTDRGLLVVGVHTPGYSFGRDPETVADAVERLEIHHPVVLDPDFEVWRRYGNPGWPGRYLFDHDARLIHLHYGEGEYRETELAVQEALAGFDPETALPEPLEPVRPEDVPGVLLEPQTADLRLPADRGRLELVRDWLEGEDYIEAKDAGAAASFSYSAGAAWAVLSGSVRPGLYETGDTVVADSPGLRLHGVQFTPISPVDGS